MITPRTAINAVTRLTLEVQALLEQNDALTAEVLQFRAEQAKREKRRRKAEPAADTPTTE